MKVFIDGAIVDREEGRISVVDHGLLYGDGVFEGMRAHGGVVFAMDRHLKRLTHGARALHLELPGGIEAIRAKSIVLTDLFIELVERRCGGYGLGMASPLAPRERGSQVSLTHPTHGYEIVQALIARGVIGDFRAPDILRFGFTPLYTRFVDVWDAVDRLAGVLERGEWRDPRYAVRSAVT